MLEGKILIHEYTPMPKTSINKSSNSNVINIDAGCVFIQIEGYSKLVAISLVGFKFI